MADENDVIDAPEDLGTDDQGRKIIYVHTLSKPLEERYKGSGERVFTQTQLRFREPTGADIVANGVPSKLVFGEDGSYSIDFDAPKMGAMMRALLVPYGKGSDAIHEPLAIRSLPSNDWIAIAYALARFFTPAPSTA